MSSFGNPTTVDMVKLLIDESVVTDPANSQDWPVFIGVEPDKPDECVTLYDTGGLPPDAKFLLEYQTFQTRVRGLPGGYIEAYTKLQEVRNVLQALPSQDVNGTRYDGVWAESDIIFLGRQEQKPLFVMNWRVIREPSGGENRVPL